jgi:hypothetical protein
MVVLLSPGILGEMRRKEQFHRAENLRVGLPQGNQHAGYCSQKVH